MKLENSIPRVSLHPQTIKHIKVGHPWVTEDSFTKKFPVREKFLVGKNSDNKDFALFIHDPKHQKVKARLWSLITSDENLDDNVDNMHSNFWSDFEARCTTALKKRKNLISSSERDNFYLIFGESDFLPGLFLQKFKNHYVLGTYSHFWEEYLETRIKTILLKLLQQFFQNFENHLWIQSRNKQQEKKIVNLTDPAITESQLQISEFGINYKILINSYYDFGIYTDMSAIRPIIAKKFKEISKNSSPNLLNLFSYTSAYSLYFLKENFKEVVSVDLSKKYLDWSKENLALNPELTKNGIFHSLCLPVQAALKKLKTENRSFDLIISDPPSASSDGDKMSSALKFYEEEFLNLSSLVSANGLLVLFLNTHTISRKKFEEKINSLIITHRLQNEFSIIKRIGLDNDCPTLKGFIEGDYLKGLILHRKVSA